MRLSRRDYANSFLSTAYEPQSWLHFIEFKRIFSSMLTCSDNLNFFVFVVFTLVLFLKRTFPNRTILWHEEFAAKLNGTYKPRRLHIVIGVKTSFQESDVPMFAVLDNISFHMTM
jgi:hypothetical protein